MVRDFQLRRGLCACSALLAAMGWTASVRAQSLDEIGLERKFEHLSLKDGLCFSKLKHRGPALGRRPVDLRTLAEVVLTLSRPLVGSKHLELVNDIAPDLPPADGDENRLQQILHNLGREQLTKLGEPKTSP